MKGTSCVAFNHAYISRKQLRFAASLSGTDYNDGLPKVGPYKAIDVAKTYETTTVAQIMGNDEIRDTFDMFHGTANVKRRHDRARNSGRSFKWKEPDERTVLALMNSMRHPQRCLKSLQYLKERHSHITRATTPFIDLTLSDSDEDSDDESAEVIDLTQ